MKNVRWATAALTAIVAAGLLVAAASARDSSSTKQAASIKACALLPDTVSSTRYTLFDAPYLKAAFKKAGVAATVVNAHADPQKQKNQAQQCLAQGAKVILLDQLDPISGASITNLAVSGGAKVIDYDRLVVHSKASYYVSFNNVTVGKLQGNGLVGGLRAKGTYSTHPVIAARMPPSLMALGSTRVWGASATTSMRVPVSVAAVMSARVATPAPEQKALVPSSVNPAPHGLRTSGEVCGSVTHKAKIWPWAASCAARSARAAEP